MGNKHTRRYIMIQAFWDLKKNIDTCQANAVRKKYNETILDCQSNAIYTNVAQNCSHTLYLRLLKRTYNVINKMEQLK